MNKLISLTLLLFSLQLSAQEMADSSATDSTPQNVNKALIYYSGEEQTKPMQVEIVQQPIEKGILVVVEEDSLSLLIEGYREQKKTEGFKIQLYSGRSRMDALKVKSSFLKMHGDKEEVILVYQQPNFKIRVGNYRDRIEANQWLEIYKEEYPSSFIVKDVIDLGASLKD